MLKGFIHKLCHTFFEERGGVKNLEKCEEALYAYDQSDNALQQKRNTLLVCKLYTMAIRVVEFFKKFERFLHKNQHTKRKLSNCENWVNGGVVKS
jgi:hypothetical protein